MMIKENNIDQPLVSVVIPTYCRPEYFELALKSVLNQTYRNIEIFITDNSPDTRTRDLMKGYLERYPNIIYEHHPEYNEMDNWNRAKAYNNPKAEYVNWLMDDDLFMPNKIEYMLDKFLHIEGISLVTSYRQCIDENGNVMPDFWYNKSLVSEDTIFKGKAVGKKILSNLFNFVGEPTTVLIKKSCMKNGTLGSRTTDAKNGISDFPTWLYCMEKGNLYYVAEPLSQFRIHAGQEQRNINCHGIGCCRWAMEFLYELDAMTYWDSKDEFLNVTELWVTMLENYVDRAASGEKYVVKIAEDLIGYAEKIIKERRKLVTI